MEIVPQRSHRSQGPRRFGVMDYDVTGCQYNPDGTCLDCPYRRCYHDLSGDEMTRFAADYRRNQAIDWRVNMWDVKRAIYDTGILEKLLKDGYEPFGVVMEGPHTIVYCRKEEPCLTEKEKASRKE